MNTKKPNLTLTESLLVNHLSEKAILENWIVMYTAFRSSLRML